MAITALNGAFQEGRGFFVTAVLDDGRTYHGTIQAEDASFTIYGRSSDSGIAPDEEELPAEIDPGNIRHIKITVS